MKGNKLILFGIVFVVLLLSNVFADDDGVIVAECDFTSANNCPIVKSLADFTQHTANGSISCAGECDLEFNITFAQNAVDEFEIVINYSVTRWGDNPYFVIYTPDDCTSDENWMVLGNIDAANAPFKVTNNSASSNFFLLGDEFHPIAEGYTKKRIRYNQSGNITYYNDTTDGRKQIGSLGNFSPPDITDCIAFQDTRGGEGNWDIWISYLKVIDGREFLVPPPTEFTTTATDLYDGSAISNFTVILSNATDTYINSTTTGEINWGNITAGIYDINFTSNQAGGYFNVSFENVDVSSDLAAEMFQSVLILNATDLTDGSQIIGFTATVPLQINHSNSSGQAILLLKAGEYNVVGNESNHLNVTKTISVNALEIKFETLEFGSSHLHINATDIITGVTISTFNVLLEDLNSDFTGNISTTSGEVTFSLEIGNFTITVLSTDHVTLVENVTVDTIHTNHTSQLQKRNSILINIFAEGNQSVLNWTNVTASFDSDTSVFSSKSANGTIYLEDVTPEEYTITFSALNFDSRDYFINLISGSNVNLDVYLISSGTSTEITFTIVDASTSLNLEDILVSVAKKINLSFITIAQKESDISGVVIFDLDQSIKYRFTLSKTGFDTRTFDLTPTSTTYTIELTPESVIDYTTIFDRIDFTTLPLNTSLRTGSIVDFSIIAASLDGTVIDYFGVNSTFNGTNFITNTSTSPAGGTATIQLNFDGFIGSVGVTYFIDLDGFDPVRIDRNFYVSNVTAGNQSISEVIDLFDRELGTSKEGRLWKAIIAVAFIIIIMATIASMGVRDRRLNVVAACGLGFFMIFGWVPAGITIAIMVILLGSFFIGGMKGGTDG